MSLSPHNYYILSADLVRFEFHVGITRTSSLMNSCMVVSLSVITATYDAENHQVLLTAAVLAHKVCFIDFTLSAVVPEHISFASASAIMGLNGVDGIYGLY